MRLLPILLVLLLLPAAVPASAGPGLFEVTITAPALAEAGGPVSVEGEVSAWGIPAVATLDLYVDGKRVAGYILYYPWFEVSVPLPAERGPHTIHAVVWAPASGLRAQSAPVVVTAAVRPSAPLDVAAAAVPDAHAMLVSWSPPADDGGAPLASYRVYRAPAGTTFWALRATVAASATSFEDVAQPSTTYRYRVAAVQGVGEGAPSAFAEATSGPRVSADAVSVSQVRFRVCWYYSQGQQTCEVAPANSSVRYSTSMAWVEPLLEGQVSRAGKPLAYDHVSARYFWDWDYCIPGDVCAPVLNEAPTLNVTSTEAGRYSFGSSSWSHQVTSGAAGCDRFSMYATVTAGSGRAEPVGWVDLCH